MTSNDMPGIRINQTIPIWALIVGFLTAGAAWGSVVIQNSVLQNSVVDMKADVSEIKKDVRQALEKHANNKTALTIQGSRLDAVERRLERLVK